MATQVSIAHLETIGARALEELQRAAKSEELEEWRVRYLGRRGELTQSLRALSALGPDERRTVGAAANKLKERLETGLLERQQAVKEAEAAGLQSAEAIDVTLPGRPVALGRLHPITQTLREICGAFVSMGFQVMEGPEVEWDHYNFEMLNIPKGHPARDKFSTLWVDYVDESGERPMLLRTHTSPMQTRIMEKTQPPIRVIVPGKVYRYEATDATHEWHFAQVEGLAVDDGITFANLKGTLFEFARRIFGEERRIRFRCDYFPFVEPGVDLSVDCFACKGQGCRICKETGWLEIAGAGMVHPKVLEGVGYDSSVYTGFAFGMGVERIAMLKYGIDDIRLFYGNDIRFLRQF